MYQFRPRRYQLVGIGTSCASNDHVTSNLSAIGTALKHHYGSFKWFWTI